MSLDSELVPYHVDDICRSCLAKADNMKNIFATHPKYKCYASMLREISSVPVAANDNFPGNICATCAEILEKCCDFRNNVIRAHTILHHYLTPRSGGNKLLPEASFVFSKRVETTAKSSSENDLKVTQTKSVELSDSAGSIEKVTTKTDKFCATLQKLSKNRSKCPLCLKNVEEKLMAGHFYSHYSSCDLTPLIVGGKKVLSCNLCNKTYRYNAMVIHHRIHLKIYPFECTIKVCGKSFATIQGLAQHLDAHAGIARYQCPVCGKTFVLRSSLKNHEVTHIIENVSCEICHKTYKNRTLLDIHLKRHKNELK